MRRVLLVDAAEHQLLSIEGRLRGMGEVSHVVRADGDGTRLGLVVETKDATGLTQLIENRIQLLPGVGEIRVLDALPAALAGQLAKATV